MRSLSRDRLFRGALLALGGLILLPATTSAHTLTGRYDSPLPLTAYLGGAAVAVALSFAILILRSRGAMPDARPSATGRVVRVPGFVRMVARALGLIVWLWIVIQGVVGSTSSDADVGSLFIWTYGWVGLPIISAFVGPVWEWLDPFSTLHDLGAVAVRRLGLPRWRTVPYASARERWPAVAAMVVFIWLELVYTSARGGRVLALAVVLYTAWTLLMMARYGRDTWRRNGETFTVWLGVLNRLAPFAPADEHAATLRRRPFAAGLLESSWLSTELILIAVGTASILFDGLSQTQAWFDLFGLPSLPAATVQLVLFLAAITALVLLVARVVGTRAMAAGLVPIALGYLIAHYFTALVFDGQRIVAVVSDPFNVGWNLFGTASFEAGGAWLPYGIVWAVELIAVVGGHIYGAVTGHRAAVMPEPLATVTAASATGRGTVSKPTAPPGTAGSWPPAATGLFADVRLRQVPLAVVMVFLTTLTLWSLGQNLVHTAS
jgi:hypothetical protein